MDELSFVDAINVKYGLKKTDVLISQIDTDQSMYIHD